MKSVGYLEFNPPRFNFLNPTTDFRLGPFLLPLLAPPLTSL